MADVKSKGNAEIRAVLYYLGERAASNPIKLRRDTNIIGREKGDILIDDPEISSTHCQIQNINGVYHLFDMNSTNGTFLNRERIVKAKLSHGDQITLGKSEFRFTLEEDAKVRHISTIFKSARIATSQQKASIVDTLIEGEVRHKISYSLHLKIKYKDGSADEVVLAQRLVFVGRASSFGRFEEDPEISRKHLLIKLNDHGNVFVEDQGSTNGSFLNGNKISGMQQIQAGDWVRIGAIEILISVISS